VNHQQVSTFLTAGSIKFMLLHSGKSEDSIRNFFTEVYELYVKVSATNEHGDWNQKEGSIAFSEVLSIFLVFYESILSI
jgi:hypothetical protein